MQKDNIQLLKLVFDTLSQLSESQISDLLKKKARLRLEYPKNVNEPTQLSLDTTQICDKLNSIQTREEAQEYFNSLSITKGQLKEVVKYFNIPVMSKDTNEKLIEKIIEAVIGSKLRYDALLNTNLK